VNYAGIEIGGTKLQLVLGDESGKIHEAIRLPVERGKGAAGIQRQIEVALPRLIHKHSPRGIGAGFGGPVDWKTGKICRSHQIEGWSEFELGTWLDKLSGVPVVVDNDANVAALGEAMRGAGAGCNPVFYVTLGSGVGGGLVVDGRIYHGATPGESEIGHVRLDRSGTTLESRCSGWAIDAKIRSSINEEPKGALAQIVGSSSGGEAKHLAAAFRQGDVAAQRILDEVSEDLAFGLSHVTHLFHPEIIIIGGGLSQAGEPLRARVEARLKGSIMEVFAPGPKIAMAALGEDAVPVGALELARGQAQ
jgi:glucokinase